MTFSDLTLQLKAKNKGQIKWNLGEKAFSAFSICMMHALMSAFIFPGRFI